MAEKTYADLTAATDVQDADLLATWRPSGPGPLKKIQASILRTYMRLGLGTASMADVGTSGHVLGYLDGANSWTAPQAFLSSGTIPTPGPGTSDAGLANTEFVTAAIAADVQRGYFSGYTMSTAGGSGALLVGPGLAADSTNTVWIAVAGGGLTKNTNAWVAGNSQGGLDAGTIANNTWYHWYAIRRPDTGQTDIVFSTNAAAPTLPTNYTQYIWVGAMLTSGSALWTSFIQDGDDFWLKSPPQNAGPVAVATTPVLLTVTTPLGVKTTAWLRTLFSNPVSAGTYGLIYAAELGTMVANSPSGNANLSLPNNNQFQAAELRVRTNTSSQVAVVTNAVSSSLYAVTVGWTVHRVG